MKVLPLLLLIACLLSLPGCQKKEEAPIDSRVAYLDQLRKRKEDGAAKATARSATPEGKVADALGRVGTAIALTQYYDSLGQHMQVAKETWTLRSDGRKANMLGDPDYEAGIRSLNARYQDLGHTLDGVMDKLISVRDTSGLAEDIDNAAKVHNAALQLVGAVNMVEDINDKTAKGVATTSDLARMKELESIVRDCVEDLKSVDANKKAAEAAAKR
jgi:hypothetical protein